MTPHRISIAVLGALADHLTGPAARALADDLPEAFALPLKQTGEAGEPGGMDEFYAAVSERSGLYDAAGAVGAVLRAARGDRWTPLPSLSPASSFPPSCAACW